jgi:hypothetical protein
VTRLEGGTWTEVTPLFDFVGHAVSQPVRPPRKLPGGRIFALVFELRHCLQPTFGRVVYDVLELHRGSAQEQDENNEWNRNSDEPKQNRHGSLLSLFDG